MSANKKIDTLQAQPKITPMRNRFQAVSLLNQDRQPRAKGTVLFVSSDDLGRHGWFYPRSGQKISQDIELQTIESILTPTKIYHIENLQLCPNSFPNNCDAPQHRYSFDIGWEQDAV
jgi:hypothetical protein